MLKQLQILNQIYNSVQNLRIKGTMEFSIFVSCLKIKCELYLGIFKIFYSIF